MAAKPTLFDAPYHPDRDGCECERRGLSEHDECVYEDPCWVSRTAYEVDARVEFDG